MDGRDYMCIFTVVNIKTATVTYIANYNRKVLTLIYFYLDFPCFCVKIKCSVSMVAEA